MSEKHFDPYKIDIRELSIYITDQCNKTCKHCYMVNGNTHLDPQCVQWMVDNFEIKKAILIGGEPVLSANLPEILEILKNSKVNVSMSTNCKWINWGKTIGKKTKKTLPTGHNDMTYNNVITMLKDKVDNIQISIEGDKKTTDQIRGKGSYQDSMDAVDLLKKNGFKTFFRATYSQSNYNDIPKMLDLATEKQIPLSLFPYKGIDSVPLTMEQQEQLYNTLMNYTDDKHIARVEIPQYDAYCKFEGAHCPAGRNLLNIMPDGTITPCEMSMPPDHFILGKFKDGTLDKELLMKRIGFFLENMKSVHEECLLCKNHKVCRSGCHETREWMNCPLKHNIDFSMYQESMGITDKQFRSKRKISRSFGKNRKGC
jgi:radical SAM protein with 4Fe4S-binding SPASM domain